VKRQASKAEPDPPEAGGSIFKSAHNNPLRQKIIEIIGISQFWVSFAQNRKKPSSPKLAENMPIIIRDIPLKFSFRLFIVFAETIVN